VETVYVCAETLYGHPPLLNVDNGMPVRLATVLRVTAQLLNAAAELDLGAPALAARSPKPRELGPEWVQRTQTCRKLSAEGPRFGLDVSLYFLRLLRTDLFGLRPAREAYFSGPAERLIDARRGLAARPRPVTRVREPAVDLAAQYGVRCV